MSKPSLFYCTRHICLNRQIRNESQVTLGRITMTARLSLIGSFGPKDGYSEDKSAFVLEFTGVSIYVAVYNLTL